MMATTATSSLLVLLGAGGAAHRKVFARLQRWRAQARRAGAGRGVSLTASHPWLRMLLLPVTWPDHWLKRRLLAQPTAANAVRRLDLGLQADAGAPVLAWLIVVVFGSVAGALVIGRALRPDFPWERIVDGGRFGLCMGMFGVVAGAPIGRLKALWGRRREQALLALLPGPPAGCARAAALERQWRREAMALWTLGGLLLLFIAAQGSSRSLHFIGGYLAACLPLGVWVETRWRALRGTAATALPALVLFAGSIGAAFLAQHYAVPAALSLPIGVALHVAALRLRGQPTGAVLPVGRAAARP
jgi:hypothetical protein